MCDDEQRIPPYAMQIAAKVAQKLSESDSKLSFFQMAPPGTKSKFVAAKVFYALLVLRSVCD